MQLLQPAINRLYKEFYGRFQFAVAGFGLYNDGSPVNECVEIEKIFTNGYKALSSYPEYVKYLKTYTNFAEHYGFNKPYRRYWWKQMLDYPTLYGDIDVLLLPVGGKYTLPVEAAVEFVRQVEPKIVVPMHFAIPGLKIDIAGAEQFIHQLGATARRLSTLSINKATLPEEGTVVDILEPVALGTPVS